MELRLTGIVMMVCALLVPSSLQAQSSEAWDWSGRSSSNSATAPPTSTVAASAALPDAASTNSESFWEADHAAEIRAEIRMERELKLARERIEREIAAEQQRAALLARQREAQRLALAQQQRARQEAERKKRRGGFSLGKALALTTGAVLGGATDLDAGSQVKLLGGILADSMNGSEGASNLQGAMNGIVASKTGPTSSGRATAAGKSSQSFGPLRPNILDPGRAKCSDNGQVQAMCQVTDAYYARYVQVHNEGNIDPSQLYDAHKVSATEAMRYMQNARVHTGFEK